MTTNAIAPRKRPLAWLPITLLVMVNIIIGLLLVPDYGKSWDEDNAQAYGRDTVNAYITLFKDHRLTTHYGPENIRYKGPAYFLISDIAAYGMKVLGSGWDETTVWHLLYFLSFQLAVVSLYLLARRWMSAWAAFGAALLFSTQPLLWGHAFINPKDIPFMGFFAASVAAGFSMVDWVAKANPFTTNQTTSVNEGGRLGDAAKGFARQSLKGFTFPYVLLAGALVGFTTSIRVLGPWAGGLVALYAIYKLRRYAVGLLVPYFTATVVVTYLTWPFLWADPVRRILDSLIFMSDFPWDHRVLFEGQLILAHDLPAYFMPKLMLLQFTESALLFFVIGLGVGIMHGLRAKIWEPLALFVLWFLLPLVAIIVQGSTVYDNFRQVLFLLPPLFIIAGLAFDWIFGRLKNVYFRGAVLTLAILPGIISIITLHPYEYVYYNSLIGGERGAFRQYEMDYWGTAYREAALYVNRVAPQGASIVVYGPYATYSPYSKASLKTYTVAQATKLAARGSGRSYDYAVLTTRYNSDLRRCPGQETIGSIERQGGILVVIKKISPGLSGCP